MIYSLTNHIFRKDKTMNRPSNYVAFHVHTEKSLLDSTTKHESYTDRAVELGQTALGFSEHGNIYNWIEKKTYMNKKGLKYLHDAEIYLTKTHNEELRERDNYHTILIAKNYKGVKEINELIGLSTRADHMYYKPRISFEEFFNISDNVIKISACLASPLNQYPTDTKQLIEKRTEALQKELDETIAELNKQSVDEALEKEWAIQNNISDNDVHMQYLLYLKDKALAYTGEYRARMELEKQNIVREFQTTYDKLLRTYDYYEIQPHIHSLEQIEYNKKLYELSKKYNKPLIAGTDTHSIDSYKAECRTILQKAKNIVFSNEDEFDLTYKSCDELIEMFRQQNSLPMEVIYEAIENTNRMADSVEDFVLDTSVKYPKLYDNELEVLNNLIKRKLKEKLDNGIIEKKDLPKYISNIKEEMRVFKKINMVGFMLFMSELVCWCWDNGIPIGFCRGSVGGSTVAYITDIIDVDPIKWNTIFSRFANEDREEVGDIDIDIAPDQRDLVYQHIIETFGYDKTAYILSIGTVSDKGTIDEIGRALNIPLDEVAQIKNAYSTYKNTIDTCKSRLKELNEVLNDKDENDENLDETIVKLFKEYNKVNTDLENGLKQMQNLKEQYSNIFYYFDGLNGTAISQSYHPAGIVVSPISLPDNYGVFWNKEGKHIMYINMEEIHDGAGLVKYDLLGLKNIEIIRKCCEYANIPYPKSHSINWLDKNVWNDIILSPAGIFQFESSYAFQLLHDYKPTCINDLSMINASLRPSGASYRDRLLAREVNKNPSQLIDDLLADNHGFLIFQEDTIKFLQQICGLSGSDADNVRRAIGKFFAL